MRGAMKTSLLLPFAAWFLRQETQEVSAARKDAAFMSSLII